MHKGMLVRYLPAALLIAGFVLVYSTRSQVAVPLTGSLESVLPAWSGMTVKAQTISDEERRIAGMSDYVARSYWQDSTVAFTAYVGYYDRQAQGKSMHSPRNCLPGAGWEVLKADTGIVSSAGKRYVVNKYLLKNGGSQALVFYWYQGRGRVVASEYTVKWNLLHDAALLGHTEEALVRIMVPVARASALDQAGLAKALADAQTLGETVGASLLTDVQRVLPGPAISTARVPATAAVMTTASAR
ncbi:MAG: exosortase C-terminal domain/associated protein EpsI [Gemmatimonadaceae bacterium]